MILPEELLKKWSKIVDHDTLKGGDVDKIVIIESKQKAIGNEANADNRADQNDHR